MDCFPIEHNYECRILFIVMFNVILLNVVILTWFITHLVVYLLFLTNSQFKNWVEYSQVLLFIIIHRVQTPHSKPPLTAKDSFV
jgi:hypothetical protein